VSPRRIVPSLLATAMLALAAASPASAAVQPGAQTFTEGAQCTSNFVFADGAGVKYLGQAAHCSGTGAATDTNGCEAGSLPLGTAVEIDGATRPGTLAYSSWLTMQSANETDADACQYNDLGAALLEGRVWRVNAACGQFFRKQVGYWAPESEGRGGPKA
jgi:hypothetical protein